MVEGNSHSSSSKCDGYKGKQKKKQKATKEGSSERNQECSTIGNTCIDPDRKGFSALHNLFLDGGN